jgi:glycosyltransferase involved in cell wall biosynthesis
VSDQPFVSIVMPTRGARPALGEAIDSLLAQDYPQDRYELIVVANDAAEPVRPPARVRLVSLSEANANAARNVGVRVSRGDPVCLVDDDVVAPPGWLRALVAGSLRHRDAGCVGGPIRARFDSAPPRTCSSHDLAGATLDEGREEHEVEEVWAANMAVTREALRRAGPLLERLRVADEAEWQQRLVAAGGRIVYVPDAWLWHRRDAGDLHVSVLLRRSFRLGYAVVALGQRRPAARYWQDLRGAAAHGVRSRCTRGITDAARALGSLCAIGAGRRRRPWATSLRD